MPNCPSNPAMIGLIAALVCGLAVTGWVQPSAPTNLAASQGVYPDKVALTWDSVTNADGYIVYRGADADTNAASVIGWPATNTYDDITAGHATNYYYWVTASNSEGISEWSSSNSGYLGLSPPTALDASDGTYTDKVAVTWDTVTGAVGYIVYRSESADTNTANPIGAPAITNFDDTNAVPGSNYYYWAQATNNLAVSGLSPSNTGWRGLAAPAFIAASQGAYTDKAVVTWGASEGANWYRVIRAESGDTSTAVTIGISVSTNYNDTSAVPAQVYYYWTRAFASTDVYSDLSPSNTGWRAFSAPTSLAASDGTHTDKVAVTWSASFSALGYVVYRSTSADTNTANPIGTAAAAASYNDTNVAPNVTNYYWTKATNAFGVSGFSPSDTGWRAAPATPPDAPASLAASDGTYTDKIAVTWSASAGALGYIVYRSTSSATNTAAMIGVSAAASFDDTTAVPETTYHYWAKATNAVGASGFSPSDTGWRAAVPIPPLPAPADIAASDGTYWDKVRVTWHTVAGATSYLVFRSLTNSTDSASLAGTSSDTTYDDNAATNWPKTHLYYWVRAANAQTASAFSASAQGVCAANPTVQTPLSGDFDGDQKNDLALYQESSGSWSFKLSASGYAAVSARLGGLGYRQVAKDYDGDLKADPGVYDEATGDWAIMLSENGYIIATLEGFGGESYVPVVGDYDGDLKADPALYHKNNGTWLIKLSGSGYGTAILAGFGGAGYTAMALDFDGDGKTDPGIYQEATGEWTVKLSGNSYASTTITDFGGPGYQRVSGMYDADARADAAIYQTATGNWEVMLSASAYITALLPGFGGTDFTPVVGDFDGDGKADPALYQESTATWSVKLSGSDYATVQAQQ